MSGACSTNPSSADYSSTANKIDHTSPAPPCKNRGQPCSPGTSKRACAITQQTPTVIFFVGSIMRTLVREGGLEPPRPRAKAPKTFASTYSATRARDHRTAGTSGGVGEDRYGCTPHRWTVRQTYDC